MKSFESKKRFEDARRQCVALTTTLAIEELPSIWMYSISLPARAKSIDLDWDEKHFHAFDHFAGITTHPHEESWMLGVLCQDGYVPRWIDLSILTITEDHTIFCATISDVVTRYEDGGNPHYTERALKPWGVKSPPLPPDWKSPEESGRFSIFRTQQRNA
jgi:hypothetical protein